MNNFISLKSVLRIICPPESTNIIYIMSDITQMSDLTEYWTTQKSSKFQFGWKTYLVAIFNQLSCCQPSLIAAISRNDNKRLP